MEKRLITGNEAVALGALRAGVKVATGYPGTPSTGCLESLLAMSPMPGRHVEWSVNEKVALEIAAGAAWAGQRSLCTMKMSGVNVAYDTLCSVAYSGVVGGLVLYVADDPGASAGMVEQDSRGFALLADLPMLEAASVAEAYTLTKAAFELSERTAAPVLVRLVAGIANAYARVEVEAPEPPADRPPVLIHDINRFTKAGAAITMAQHYAAIARLEEAGRVVAEMRLNRLYLAPRLAPMAAAVPAGAETSESGRGARETAAVEQPAEHPMRRQGLGIIAAGAAVAYIDEGIGQVAAGRPPWDGFGPAGISVLRIAAVNPFPSVEVQAILRHCGMVIVLEELEPFLEKSVIVEAHSLGYDGRIIGKLDGTFSRVGEYGAGQVVKGLAKALDLVLPAAPPHGDIPAESRAAARPITFCAGCPHRGTYLAINQALRKLRYKPGQVMVTGDIGCTILGMNPPFNTVWNEVSMGASIPLAQGFVHAGVATPVIATIGDSTFFHGGIPGLINAVQHQTPLTLIILDNGWTSMTGMQVNPGTDPACRKAGNEGWRVDIAAIVPALGVEHLFTMDPFDLAGSAATVQKALQLPGVKVILSRQECAIPAMRRGVRAGAVTVVPEKCNLCKLCISVTGCPAISLAGDTIAIDPVLCYGCGLCVEVCNRDAIVTQEVAV